MQENQIQQPQQDILLGLAIPKNNHFQKLTRQKLLKKAYELDAKNKSLIHKLANLQPQKQKQTNPPCPQKQAKLFQKYLARKYALKIAYVGISYNGLTIQKSTQNTIQNYLFKSFHSSGLIPNVQPGDDYTRAGRTDRGVSSFGNVIALNLRTSIEKVNPNKDNQTSKIAYAKILNSILPNDIRILAVSEVPADFNARYWCTQRSYKYFFVCGFLDLQKMKQAIKQFQGTHNFINFCRIDVVATTNYERTIKMAKIQKLNKSLSSLDKDPRNQIYYFNFVGNAFLWHQIRFMATILFLVGSHKQDSSIVSQLLNPQRFPKKPNYPISPQYPLILEHCKYDNFEFDIKEQEGIDFYNTFNEIIMEKLVQITLFVNCMSAMKGWVYTCLGIQQKQLIEQSVKIEQKYFKSKINKKLGLHKSTCIGVEQAIGKLKGRRLQLFQKRQKKQQEYEERVAKIVTQQCSNKQMDDGNQ